MPVGLEFRSQLDLAPLTNKLMGWVVEIMEHMQLTAEFKCASQPTYKWLRGTFSRWEGSDVT